MGNLIGCGANSDAFFIANCGLAPQSYHPPPLKVSRSLSRKGNNKIAPLPVNEVDAKLCNTEELKRSYLKLAAKANFRAWKPKLETIHESSMVALQSA